MKFIANQVYHTFNQGSSKCLIFHREANYLARLHKVILIEGEVNRRLKINEIFPNLEMTKVFDKKNAFAKESIGSDV